MFDNSTAWTMLLSVDVACIVRDARHVHCQGSADDRPAGDSHAAACHSKFRPLPGTWTSEASRSRLPVNLENSIHAWHRNIAMIRSCEFFPEVNSRPRPFGGTVARKTCLLKPMPCLKGDNSAAVSVGRPGHRTCAHKIERASDLLT